MTAGPVPQLGPVSFLREMLCFAVSTPSEASRAASWLRKITENKNISLSARRRSSMRVCAGVPKAEPAPLTVRQIVNPVLSTHICIWTPPLSQRRICRHLHTLVYSGGSIPPVRLVNLSKCHITEVPFLNSQSDKSQEGEEKDVKKSCFGEKGC